MPFNFVEEHRDPKKFLDSKYSRQLSDQEHEGEHMCGPIFMDDEEFRQCVVDDLLAFTMWEIQTGQKLDANFDQLVRFIGTDQKDRVREELQHPELAELVVDVDGQIRIKNDPAILQAAMDYCGAWYDGFLMPTEGVIQVNREACVQSLEQYGSIENFASALAMELSSTVPGSSVKH